VASVDSSRCPRMIPSAAGAPGLYGFAETVNTSLHVHSTIWKVSVGHKPEDSFAIHRRLL
jgi:hypothetical protein